WNGLGVEEVGSRLTIALGEFEKDRVVATAAKLLRLVHQRLLHGLVPAEDHHPSGSQVHCVNCAEFLAQLQPSPLTLVRDVSISWERSCSKFPRNGRALGPGGSRPLPFEPVGSGPLEGTETLLTGLRCLESLRRQSLQLETWVEFIWH
ncbi:hypothetical protein Celaphus_00004379, partial [Cervus elaphus hippelaphus]